MNNSLKQVDQVKTSISLSKAEKHFDLLLIQIKSELAGRKENIQQSVSTANADKLFEVFGDQAEMLFVSLEKLGSSASKSRTIVHATQSFDTTLRSRKGTICTRSSRLMNQTQSIGQVSFACLIPNRVFSKIAFQ